MGRHRRSAAGRKGKGGTPTPPVTGTAPAAGNRPGQEQYRTTYDAYGSYPQGSNSPYVHDDAYGHGDSSGSYHSPGHGRPYGGDDYARSHAYLFGTEESSAPVHVDAPTAALPVQRDTAAAPPGRGPRGKRPRRPVRTGLLGVSAALAVGVVAAATGIVPGLDTYRLGGDGSIRAIDGPGNAETQQGGSGGRVDPGAPSAGTGTGSVKPSPSASPSASAKEKKEAKPSPSRTAAEKTATPEKAEPTTKAPEPKAPPADGADLSREDAARAAVLQLVNQERSAAGCSPVKSDGGLTELADDFSQAMADEGFFDHTDPSGATPWDRAAAAGVDNLGGENIARGQADAAAVMDAWMQSDGHRANILNCDFKTLGVGVHFASGGPWWTQDFGY
ncbi:CAP domain-containing protein [Streptomyces abyssomicinicus]|uniref:CAP domain-containing protein n=1 Tax=Streptomyces abyssomicinicus TaxID=574929 RepID=UPI00124FE490|nr:CAP domain-containing protein [Streptomyces abyssomicinicus]